MNKVTIEVTKTGWTTSVNIKGKTFIEEHIATPTGAKCIKGNFENDKEIKDDLYQELSGFTAFDIMLQLKKYK